ncbi:MAG: hypothetical protein ACTFAK_04635 [Candidatus Electronema sp. VV]
MCDDFLYHHNVLTHHFLFYHYPLLFTQGITLARLRPFWVHLAIRHPAEGGQIRHEPAWNSASRLPFCHRRNN